MKKLITTVMLWAGLFISHSFTQVTYIDTLNILNQEEIFIKIASSDIHKLKHSADIYQLVSEFKTNLKSVIDQIPEYDIFTISYVKNKSLKVEEVQGIAKYQMENGQMIKAHNQSIAHLKHNNIHLFLYINKINDLLTRDYESMIKSALAKVKKGPKKWQRVYSPINEFFYSYSQGKMIDGYEKVKFKNRVGVVFGGTFGFFKSKPIYEGTVGIGYSYGVKNNRMLYLFGGILYQYNDQIETHNQTNIYGLGFRFNNLSSVSFALFDNPSEPTGFDDLTFRFTSTIYPTKGVSLSTHLYYSNPLEKDNSKIFPSISLGFGF